MTNKEKIKERKEILIDLTAKYCKEYLDDDYLQLSEKLINKLSRKRNVLFERGSLEIWAAAVIHALGSINFLFDKSFKPYVTVDNINKYFGTKRSSSSNKSREIREILKLNLYDSEFSTKQMEDSNPFNSMIVVDGFIVPIDSLPPEYQEIVREARARGEHISFTAK